MRDFRRISRFNSCARARRKFFRHLARRRFARTRAEDESFEQRVRGETIRAVDARAGHFARRVETRERRAPVEVCADAAHDVMRRRRDGNEVVREI